jgi:excisionase family DNA binding protein
MTAPKYISPKATADLCSLHVQTVYSMIARGIIPACRIGRAVRVDREALLAGLEAQKGVPDTRGLR